MTDSQWWSHAHHAPSTRAEPVTLGQPLWQLVKDGHTAAALVRPIDGVGLELRLEWDGELRVSEVFKGWDELEAMAVEKRSELEGRGWR
jgi:hypothetical protein